MKYVHGKGFIHRDLKPENFLIGLGKKENTVHLIDYGLAKRYRVAAAGQQLELRQTHKFVGAVRYASVNAHLRNELGRRDDLEAVGFILIYLLKGSLPWQGSAVCGGEELEEAVHKRKADTSLAELCKDIPGIVLCIISVRRVQNLFRILPRT